VERINGQPFKLGGQLGLWRLRRRLAGRRRYRRRQACTINLRFEPKEGAPQDKVSGEGSFLSSSAAMKAADPHIVTMALGYPVPESAAPPPSAQSAPTKPH